jgi:hypothetical protein
MNPLGLLYPNLCSILHWFCFWQLSMPLLYVTLREGKVWIEYDGMEQGITQDLIAAGIPPERIVLAFLLDAQIAATA